MTASSWADIVFAGDADCAVLSRAVRRGTLRRLGTGIYTGLVGHSPKAVARRSCTVVRGLLDNVSVRGGRYLLAALKAATHAGSVDPLAAMLRYAQRFTARIDFTSRETAETQLRATNAFRDAREADDLGIRLVMP